MPIDLQKEINKALKKLKIIKVDRIEKSSDLKINFIYGLYLKAYTDSCGYESWVINWNDKIYVEMEQGEITRFE